MWCVYFAVHCNNSNSIFNFNLQIYSQLELLLYSMMFYINIYDCPKGLFAQGYGVDHFFYYRPQTKFAKVMSLQVSVCPQGEGGCVAGGCLWQEGVHGRRACVVGGMCGGGMCGRRACMPCMLSPLADTMGYGQWTGGTHHTGMHSCFNLSLHIGCLVTNVTVHTWRRWQISYLTTSSWMGAAPIWMMTSSRM